MIAALADAGAVLDRDDYRRRHATARTSSSSSLRDESGRLLRTYKDGRASLNAYLEDHAFLVEALLAPLRGDLRDALVRGGAAARGHDDRPLRDPAGGFFTTSIDHERLVTRPKDIQDHPIPSGNSSAAFGLVRLAAFTGERAYEQACGRAVPPPAQAAARHPQAFGHLLQALRFHFAPRREVALVGEQIEPLVKWCARRSGRTSWSPRCGQATARRRSSSPAAWQRRRRRRPAAYVCENFACRLPVGDPQSWTANSTP